MLPNWALTIRMDFMPLLEQAASWFGLAPMALVEWMAVAFGFVCVLLTIRQNIWCWPAGLVQVTLFIFVFRQARLYSDMVLHIIYVPLQFYGFFHWFYGGEKRDSLPVTRLTPGELAFWSTLAVAGTAGWGWYMDTRFGAALPYWDAATTALSLIAQYLMAKKKLESFAIWILVDVLCIGIYFVKDLQPTAWLYAAFLVLASMGFMAWKKSMRAAQAA